jgi:uncharacterized protein YndB with AHSA1/START domain
MTKTFATETRINAPRERIWALLTDAPTYPAWNTTVDRVEGRIALHEKIRVFAKIQAGRAFPVRVATFVPDERMVWVGGMPLGLFKGERTYTLTPDGDATVFAMREVYSGPMAGLITRSIPDLQPAFDEFAAALKRRAEAGP